ncbi:hypothetical protein [Chromobacterium sp. Panama]|uniref:hypothetical protein n=1 Tax=Chromobacterium sp. Panama TaxID=2161826 RepID=UPI0011B2881D|nr:hypothetical protein [Chromobacterium sp. Panama]
MNISNFPVSRGLQDIPSEWFNKNLASAYAFYLYAHQMDEYPSHNHKIAGRVLGGFPVWYMSRKPVDTRPGATFVRNVNGENYWFYRSNSEFVAIQFCALQGPHLTGDSTVISHIEYGDAKMPRLSSTFVVSMELLTRIGLFLGNLDNQGAYPRIIVIPETSQCGLLITTNHRASWHPREHLVFPLPELSLGRSNRQGDDFRDSKMSLEQFVLSSAYPMRIASLNDAD